MIAAMGIYHLAFCCILFTTTVCSSILYGIPEHADGSLSVDTHVLNCSCENGECVTDNEGHSMCICPPGFSLKEDFTCKPCDCGSLGKCIFILTLVGSRVEYQKKCVCNTGCAEQDGICVDCFCGEKSGCEFVFGNKRCYCLDGYSEKDGVCTRCDCGLYGKCKYQNGDKKCECNEGYLVLNDMCEECDCGDHGKCSFVNGQKTCECEPGYSVNSGKCEECKCGDHAQSCNFNENKKTCSCLEGYVQKGETCEIGCSSQRMCQNGGYCKEGFCFCLNGTRGEFCEIIDECPSLCPNENDTKCAYDSASRRAFCSCLDKNLSYDSKRKHCGNFCKTNSDCSNGGHCSNGKCRCLPRTNGDRCQIIQDCENGRVKCRGSGAYCSFNVLLKIAVCKCHNPKEVYNILFAKCIRKFP